MLTPERLGELRQIAGGIGGELIEEIDRLRAELAHRRDAAAATADADTDSGHVCSLPPEMFRCGVCGDVTPLGIFHSYACKNRLPTWNVDRPRTGRTMTERDEIDRLRAAIRDFLAEVSAPTLTTRNYVEVQVTPGALEELRAAAGNQKEEGS